MRLINKADFFNHLIILRLALELLNHIVVSMTITPKSDFINNLNQHTWNFGYQVEIDFFIFFDAHVFGFYNFLLILISKINFLDDDPEFIVYIFTCAVVMLPFTVIFTLSDTGMAILMEIAT
jgi:hypothetical protein